MAAALVIHIRGDGSVEQTLTFDPFTGAAVPIDLGAEDDQVFVALFGTGMRGATGPATATVGGEGHGRARTRAPTQYSKASIRPT